MRSNTSDVELGRRSTRSPVGSSTDAPAAATAAPPPPAAAAAAAPPRYASAVAEADALFPPTTTNGHSNHPFLHYYARLDHQQNMLTDAVRTGTYRAAILSNAADFAGRVVLDVGCGTGILSVFAAQAGARRVYAVEASDMADLARKLVQANNLDDVVVVIKAKVESVQLPEPVDIVVSEPMGFFLVHERMLESFIVGRDRFLRRPSSSPRKLPAATTVSYTHLRAHET